MGGEARRGEARRADEASATRGCRSAGYAGGRTAPSSWCSVHGWWRPGPSRCARQTWPPPVAPAIGSSSSARPSPSASSSSSCRLTKRPVRPSPSNDSSPLLPSTAPRLASPHLPQRTLALPSLRTRYALRAHTFLTRVRMSRRGPLYTVYIHNLACAVVGHLAFVVMQFLTCAVLVFALPSLLTTSCRRCSWWCDLSTPRQRLRRFWLCSRLFCFLYGLIDAVSAIGTLAETGGSWDGWPPVTALSVSFLAYSLVMTPSVRGLAIRRIDHGLARFFARKNVGDEERAREFQAAVVSAVIESQMEAADVYVAAKRLFRALPLAKLTRAMMMAYATDANLHRRRSKGAESVSNEDATNHSNLEETPEEAPEVPDDVAPTQLSEERGANFFAEFALKNDALPATLGEVEAFLTYSCQ